MESYDQPAFPVHPRTNPGDPHEVDWAGMSLRDWFAGQALAGYFAAPLTFDMDTPIEEAREQVCGHIYAFADAMLAARESSK